MKIGALVLGLLLLTAEAVGADPMVFAELRLKDGQVLHNVTIVAIGSTTVMAKWDDGRGTIRIADLPEGIVAVPKPTLPPPTVHPAGAQATSEKTIEGGPTPEKYFKTPWQFETQYIVETLASDLAEMAYYAKHQKALTVDGLPATAVLAQIPGSPPELALDVRVSLGDDGNLAVILPVDKPIWAPETYQPLVAALFAKLGLTGTRPDDTDTSEIVHALLAPTVEHLVAADSDESSKLAAAFTSAAAHERAALLIAAFALRESDGKFYQTRFELCRIAAHLAFAQGLAGGPPRTTAGQLAKALLALLYSDQTSAISIAGALPEGDDSKAWGRVVRMYATSDYRIFAESKSPTVAERLARMESLGGLDLGRAWGELQLTQDEANMTDWWRKAGALKPSVQIGHQLMESRIGLELREIKIAYDSETGSSMSTVGIKALNAEPRRCVTAGEDGSASVRVIGWGTWAASLQRELCAAVTQEFQFLENGWGVPDEAADFRRKADDKFWELRLYPFVRRQNVTTDKDYYRQAQDDEMAVVRNSPQVIPAGVWNDISYQAGSLERYRPPPSPLINEWHYINPPPGTAYNIGPRMNQPSLTSRPDFREELAQLHALAPYDESISYHLAYAMGSYYPPPELLVKIYGTTVDYQPGACAWIAMQSGDKPGEYEKWMLKAVALSPRKRLTLATYYASRGRDADAEDQYERWIEAESDSVLVSNAAEWLTEYKERKGDEAGATALADRVYRTASAEGMKTKAHLQEERKLYEAAYEVYAEIRERYNNASPMVGFLQRMKDIGSPSARNSLLDNLMKTRLPGGWQPADTDLTAKPTSGAQVTSYNDESLVSQLKWDDVVVALNGHKISDVKTFNLVRDLSPGKALTLTVWRDGRYLTLPPAAGKYIYYSPSFSNYKG